MTKTVVYHQRFNFLNSLLARGILFSIFLTGPIAAYSQDKEQLTTTDLKGLSIEELLNLKVTLVSRSPQKITEAASAVQVITGEDIRNSGATNIAEALRLASNLQVAQMRSNVWLIGSRGFNTLFANKLLVMIDGRTVYTPLFAGVFWDMQNVLLEDIDRIEVVSGPGGALWGANAVNGIINIKTKSAKDTKGAYVSAVGGSFIRDHAAVRFGGKIGENMAYRVYGQHFDRNATKMPDGSKFSDPWRITQGGFRLDWNAGDRDSYTVQGDYYGGTVKTAGANSDFNGQNVLGRWTRRFSEESEFELQLYYDRYLKNDAPGLNADEINTVDIDFQHRLPVAKRHSLVWGLNYRMVNDHFKTSSTSVAILPPRKNLDQFEGFVHDEVAISDKLKVSVGTKVLHNVYTGIEIQPGVRMALSVNEKNTLWAAISRAVRTPSRIDVDYYAPPPPQPVNTFSIAGGPNFVSEKVVAYELGYRIQPNGNSSFSVATFYNDYNDVYGLEALPGTLTYVALNGTEAKTWGAEISGTYQIMDKWRLRGGYTYLDKKLTKKPEHPIDPAYLSNDARNQVLIQSMTDLTKNFHVDVVARYLDVINESLATAKVPSYFTFDTRIAYTYKIAEISLVGQNLFAKEHTEFGQLSIPRSVYAKITFRW